MKKQIEEEQNRIRRAEEDPGNIIIDESFDARDLPCENHHKNNCDECTYDDEELMPWGQ